MKEHDLRNALHHAADGCQFTEYYKRQTVSLMKGVEPVKKKLTLSFALVMAITLLTLSVAAALVHSTIVENLYGSSDDVPKVVTNRIHHTDVSSKSPLASIAVDEWYYDGRSIHTAFTITNPTADTLLYTIDGIHLNNQPVSYNRMSTEGAGDSGYLLGGMISGSSMPASVSLYNQGEALYLFDENGHFTGTAQIPEGAATLKISVAVWRPLNEPELVNYSSYEGINIAESKDHLIADQSGYSQLWLFRPESYNLYYNASQSGAEIYRDAYHELGWAELMDVIEVEAAIELNKAEAVRTVPVETEISNGQLRLVIEQFVLSHTGGQLQGNIYGEVSTLNQMMNPLGLFLADIENDRLLTSGSWWELHEDKNELTFTINLPPLSGELPQTLYLMPATAYHDTLDPESPLYDPTVQIPENVIMGWEFNEEHSFVIQLKESP